MINHRTASFRLRSGGIALQTPTEPTPHHGKEPARNKAPARAGDKAGFTLLEVMVSIAILGLGMTMLLQVQARSALLAEDAKGITVATQLARSKLYDCEVELLKRGFSVSDFEQEGKFDDEGYEDYFWECHAYKPEIPMPDAAAITDAAANAAGGGPASGPAGGLLGGLGGLGGDGAAGLGVGMIAPVLGQVSQVVGESIRELHVIVRYKQGEFWQELTVTTHLVDTAGVNAMAQQMGAMTDAMGGIPGLSGGAGSSGSRGSSRVPGPTAPPNRRGR